jgi:hypothetical protein
LSQEICSDEFRELDFRSETRGIDEMKLRKAMLGVLVTAFAASS